MAAVTMICVCRIVFYNLITEHKTAKKYEVLRECHTVLQTVT